MERDLGPVLRDILRAIDKLRALNGGQPPTELPNYSDERMIVERAIEIISEASRRLGADVRDRHPAISWNDLARIGNHIRHGYDRVDETVLLEVLKQDLDPLEAVIRAELTRIGQG